MSRAVSRATAYASLLAGLSLYLVANVLGWLVGVQSPSTAVRVAGLETSSLFFSSRVIFPFTLGINEPAFIAIALIAAVAAMVTMGSRRYWYHWTGVAAAIVVILGSNTRSVVVLGLPLIIGITIAPRLTRALSPYAVGFLMILPFLLRLAPVALTAVISSVGSSSILSRGNASWDLAAFGPRGYIWSQGIDYWSNYVTDPTHQLIGYGYRGHVSSGAWIGFTRGISYVNARTALSTHNTMLQIVYDSGLIGAAILLGVTTFTVFRYSRDAAFLPMLAVVSALGLSTLTEINITPGYGNTSAFLLLYLAVFMPIKATRRSDRPSERRHAGIIMKNLPSRGF
jgi:hypothetical protein